MTMSTSGSHNVTNRIMRFAASDSLPIDFCLASIVLSVIWFVVLVPTMRLASNTIAVIMYLAIPPVIMFVTLLLVAYRLQRDAMSYCRDNGLEPVQEPTLTAEAAGIPPNMLRNLSVISCVIVSAAIIAVMGAAVTDAAGHRELVDGDGSGTEVVEMTICGDASDAENIYDVATLPVELVAGRQISFNDAVASATGTGCPPYESISVMHDESVSDAVVRVSKAEYTYSGDGMGELVFGILGFDTGYDVDVVLPSKR